MHTLHRRGFLAASAAVLASPVRAEMPKLSCAIFSAEVTPPIGHACMGGGIAPVKEILDPLECHGVVILGLDKPVVLAAIDWCEIRNDAYDRWRDALAKAAGTTRDRVLFSALHQHDAPIADLTAQKLLDEVKAKGSICDLEFHEKTVERVAKAVKDSLNKVKTITHIGTGRATVEKVASNRRWIDDDGKPRYNRMSATRDAKIRDAAEGTIDPELTVLSLWENDKPIVAISNYATHPMSFYGRGGVTADFVGHARRKRQTDEPDTLQIYISGCSGNVTAGKYNDGDAANRPVLASRIHAAMKAAWKSTERHAVTQCTFRNTTLKLPIRTGKLFMEEQLREQLKSSPRPFAQCLAALGLSWKKRIEQPIDIGVLDFGVAAYLLLPAETYVEFQLYAKELRPKSTLVVAGYGECGPGYIPIERAWKENDGNLSDWCWVDPGCETLLKAAIEKVLK